MDNAVIAAEIVDCPIRWGPSSDKLLSLSVCTKALWPWNHCKDYLELSWLTGLAFAYAAFPGRPTVWVASCLVGKSWATAQMRSDYRNIPDMSLFI